MLVHSDSDTGFPTCSSGLLAVATQTSALGECRAHKKHTLEAEEAELQAQLRAWQAAMRAEHAGRVATSQRMKAARRPQDGARDTIRHWGAVKQSSSARTLCDDAMLGSSTSCASGSVSVVSRSRGGATSSDALLADNELNGYNGFYTSSCSLAEQPPTREHAYREQLAAMQRRRSTAEAHDQQGTHNIVAVPHHPPRAAHARAVTMYKSRSALREYINGTQQDRAQKAGRNNTAAPNDGTRNASREIRNGKAGAVRRSVSSWQTAAPMRYGTDRTTLSTTHSAAPSCVPVPTNTSKPKLDVSKTRPPGVRRTQSAYSCSSTAHRTVTTIGSTAPRALGSRLSQPRTRSYDNDGRAVRATRDKRNTHVTSVGSSGHAKQPQEQENDEYAHLASATRLSDTNARDSDARRCRSAAQQSSTRELDGPRSTNALPFLSSTSRSHEWRKKLTSEQLPLPVPSVFAPLSSWKCAPSFSAGAMAQSVCCRPVSSLCAFTDSVVTTIDRLTTRTESDGQEDARAWCGTAAAATHQQQASKERVTNSLVAKRDVKGGRTTFCPLLRYGSSSSCTHNPCGTDDDMSSMNLSHDTARAARDRLRVSQSVVPSLRLRLSQHTDPLAHRVALPKTERDESTHMTTMRRLDCADGTTTDRSRVSKAAEVAPFASPFLLAASVVSSTAQPRSVQRWRRVGYGATVAHAPLSALPASTTHSVDEPRNECAVEDANIVAVRGLRWMDESSTEHSSHCGENAAVVGGGSQREVGGLSRRPVFRYGARS